MMLEEYRPTLDWSQSKVFLVEYYFWCSVCWFGEWRCVHAVITRFFSLL